MHMIYSRGYRIGYVRLAAFQLLVGLVLMGISSVYADESKFTVKAVTPKSALGDTISVEIEDLAKWADKSHELSKSILYLDGRPLKGTKPQVDVAHNTLSFELKRTNTDESKKAWAAILGAPTDFTRILPVAIGFDDGFVVPSDATTEFTIFRQGFALWLPLAIFLFAVILFFWLVPGSAILRDSGPPPGNEKLKPYSLGRTQMAFWFFVVLASYLLIWIVTGDRDTLPQSALALIGISASTALGAVMVDASKLSAAETQLRSLKAEKSGLDQRVAQLEPAIAAAGAQDDTKREFADKKGRLEQVNQSIEALTPTLAAAESAGFLTDILTDVDGVSLHRFQIVIWTLVLGFIFWTSVYETLAMPEFPGTLLALMGISNGTYIGFKFPEKQA